MSEPDTTERNATFDYVTLRLLMGLIAFAIPLIVTYLARPIDLFDLERVALVDGVVG